MANRYWVNGTGNWSDTAHWSISSGGSSGASVPAITDDVFITSLSGLSGGTITFDMGYGELGPVMHNLLCNSGHSYTLAKSGQGSGPQIYGSAEFEAGITWPGTFGVAFKAADLGHTVKTNGMVFGKGVSFYGAGGGWTLLDNLTGNDLFNVFGGTFDANDFNITAKAIQFDIWDSGDTIVYMGDGTWTATGNDTNTSWGNFTTFTNYGSWGDYLVTVYCEGSTIKFTDSTANPKTFYINDTATDPYNNLWLTGSGTGVFQIWGSNTFNSFKVDTPPHILNFYVGSTQTVGTFDVSGIADNLMTLGVYGYPYPVPSGTNLILNGGFDDDLSYWTPDYEYGDGTFTWVSGVAAITGGTQDGIIINQTGLSLDYQGSFVIDFDLVITAGVMSAVQFHATVDNMNFGFDSLTNEGNHYHGTVDMASIGLTDNVDILNFWFNPGFIGTLDNVVLQEMITPTQVKLHKTSGVVDCDYLDISNSNATGGATWYAGSHSNDTTNNDGWIFTDPTWYNKGNFLGLF